MAEDPVTGGMAVGVVQALEVVEVDEHDREGVPVARRAGDLLVHAGEHGLPVGDARQRVHGGQPPRVRDPVGQPSECRSQPWILDPLGLDGDQGPLVRGVGEALREDGQAPVLAPHDDRREARRPGKRADQRDRQHERDELDHGIQGVALAWG